MLRRATQIILGVSAGVALVLDGVPAVAQTNIGNCPEDIMKMVRDLNQNARDAVQRPSEIRTVSCIDGAIWKIYIRAADGREMEWRPSAGTNELGRMMLLGR